MDEDLKEKIMAFKTIYRAIHEGQDNAYFYKSDFLLGKEHLTPEEYQTAIETHCATKKTKAERKKSKTIQAWSLAQKHYKNCTEENMELFNAIYSFALYNTWEKGVKFFIKSKKVKILTADEILDKLAADSVLANIYYQLAYPIPWGEIWPEPRAGLKAANT